MCRSIKTLANFDPPATKTEIRDAVVQFVRKISGFTHPSQVNTPAYTQAVAQIEQASQQLLDSLTIGAPPRNRDTEAARARTRTEARFGVKS